LIVPSAQKIEENWGRRAIFARSSPQVLECKDIRHFPLKMRREREHMPARAEGGASSLGRNEAGQAPRELKRKDVT